MFIEVKIRLNSELALIAHRANKAADEGRLDDHHRWGRKYHELREAIAQGDTTKALLMVIV